MRWSFLVGGLLFLTSSLGQAAMTCADVDYDNPQYHENMDRLAVEARFPDNSWNRNHETAIDALCQGDEQTVQSMIDSGHVRGSVVMAIKEVLGKTGRSDSGMSYEYSRAKFDRMGLCSACADNVAQHYVQQPDSQCGRLARKALEGQPHAVQTLQSFPDYCRWDYDR